MTDDENMPTFEEIYGEYGERILNVVFRLVKDEEVARDLTQEIFIKVYRNLGNFESRSGVYTWIYRIAMNHVINHQKRERRYNWLNILDTRLADVFQQKSAEPALASREPSAQQRLERDQRREIVWDAVMSLPPKLRVPYVLANWERMSYRDIADAVGISLSAVESRIHRARKLMIRKLKPWEGKI